MECREVQQLLDTFAADELEAAERQTIEKHLSECPLCQKEAQALRRTISLLGQFKEMDPPAVFIQELRQRMEKRQRRGILDRLFPRPV
ncbi:MAG: zf-HC2 domain-containing protein, partial [bacterium]|nr:zf-HC2 domain-containing protein [bacterium]